MINWIKRAKSWFLHWATTKWSGWAMFFCAFADASFLPLPTPLFFLTLVLMNITRAYRYALIATVGTMAGALAGYSIGHFAWLNVNGEFTQLAHFVFDTIPGFSEVSYNHIRHQYERWDFWILFVASLMPVPYKIFSISAGVFDINVFMVCLATLISQGAKYYFLALMGIKLGHRVMEWIQSRVLAAVLITAGSIVAAIILIKVI
jgi:membrane protein YqaA with SNARE-associated domain